MNSNRSIFVLKSRRLSGLFLLVGLVLAGTTGYQLAKNGVAVLPVLGLLAAVAVVVLAIIGLVSSPSRK
ncbi:hypothetical protein [Micromonospora chokoriensis]